MVWYRRGRKSDREKMVTIDGFGRSSNNATINSKRSRAKQGCGMSIGRKQARGLSPVISTTILLAVSVTLGLALWSMVASNTNTAGESFTNEVTDYVNYVNERYVIVNMAFEYDEPKTNACTFAVGVTDSNCVTIWIFNFSEKDVKVDEVFFGKSSASQKQVSFKIGTSDENVLKANTLSNMTLIYTGEIDGVIANDPFKQDGTIYYAKVLTEGGASQVYYQSDAKPEDV
jgi:hypothetical protein